MHFRYPVKLFFSLLAAALVSSSVYMFLTRRILHETIIPEACAAVPGPSVLLVHGGRAAPQAVAPAHLPEWTFSGDKLGGVIPERPPALDAPAPADARKVFGSRSEAPFPRAEAAPPELAPLACPEPERIPMSAPDVRRTALPSPSLRLPQFAAPDPAMDFPPPRLPAVSPAARRQEKPAVLPAAFPPEVEIITP